MRLKIAATMPRALAFLLAAFFSVAGMSLKTDAPMTFTSVIPERNGCVLVYGWFGFGTNFFVEQCSRSWRVINVFNTAGYLQKMQFVDDHRAIAVLGRGLVELRYDGKDIQGAILKRDNEKFRLWDVYFLNSTRGWACGDNGLIYRTSDGGVNWSEPASGTKADLRRIRFTDNEFGWAVGQEDESCFLTTTDGGMTWQSLNFAEQRCMSSIFFSSRSHACGVASTSELLCTWNGTDWTTIKVPDEDRSGLYFVDAKNGWTVGSSIMRTVDGGRTWTYSLRNYDKTTKVVHPLYLENVSFTDWKRGWAWGLLAVYRTVNAGRTWVKVSDKWKPALQKIYDDPEPLPNLSLSEFPAK
jgi:photosystem II stability/assembly factor-like uncharacterized protein